MVDVFTRKYTWPASLSHHVGLPMAASVSPGQELKHHESTATKAHNTI
jgi:hypothetical protein